MVDAGEKGGKGERQNESEIREGGVNKRKEKDRV